ncbi:MAG: BT4734/BF3469 family protein [Bacteroidota bacterium]
MSIISILNKQSQIIGNKSLLSLLHQIKNGSFQTQITSYRKEVDTQRQILQFTPYGTYYHKQNRLILQSYSQAILLEIESINIEDLDAIIHTICHQTYTYACFQNIERNTLKVIVFTNNEAPTEHANSYEQVRSYYERKLDLPISERGIDLYYSCPISYDPYIYINTQATRFPYTKKPTLPPLAGAKIKTIPKLLNPFSYFFPKSIVTN